MTGDDLGMVEHPAPDVELSEVVVPPDGHSECGASEPAWVASSPRGKGEPACAGSPFATGLALRNRSSGWERRAHPGREAAAGPRSGR